MTDTIPTPPGQPKRSRVPLDPAATPPPLPVRCKACGHATHYAACDVRFSWWRRLLWRREFCACTATS